jgi:hypothetical protein
LQSVWKDNVVRMALSFRRGARQTCSDTSMVML